ncbi:hypothetical protein, partial [Herbaspirillum sp. NPDC101397]|uniref:hypothetical protein n=1 Tax=Herbaspirillum sp. NPDC101397 TaxID=3364006 RepID=UPI00383AD505
EGAANLRSPSFAYFSWRSKKSERLPGRPRLGSPENKHPKLPKNNRKQAKNNKTEHVRFC